MWSVQKWTYSLKLNKFIFNNFFRFYQFTIITEDLGTSQSTLLSCLSDSSHCDSPLLSELKANNLLSELDRGKNYEMLLLLYGRVHCKEDYYMTICLFLHVYGICPSKIPHDVLGKGWDDDRMCNYLQRPFDWVQITMGQS